MDDYPLTRIDGPDYPLPKGICEIWRGKFDSDRRVEILVCEIEAKIPGLRHFVGYLPGEKVVTGTFCVPTGHTMANVTLL